MFQPVMTREEAIKTKFTSDERARMKVEGWSVSLSDNGYFWIFSCDENGSEEPIETQEQSAWKTLVLRAKTGDELAKKAFYVIQATHGEQYEVLNDAFLERPTRADLPTECKSHTCHAPVPENLKLKGIFPSARSSCQWFECKETGWSLQLEYKSSFYGYDPLDEKSENNTIRIGDFLCPECLEKRNSAMKDLLKDI